MNSNLRLLAEKFKAELLTKDYSRNTVECYTIDATQFLEFIGDIDSLDSVRRIECIGYLNSLHENKYKVSSILRKSSAISLLFNFADVKNPFIGMNLGSIELEAALWINEVEVKKLIQSSYHISNNKMLGVRNAAFIMIMYSCGLKSSEMSNVKCSDFDDGYRTLTVKDRELAIPKTIAYMIKEWVEYRDKMDICKESYNFMFISRQGSVLSRIMCFRIVTLAARHIDMQVNPTILRHSYAMRLVVKGADISDVAKKLGVNSYSTLAKYFI